MKHSFLAAALFAILCPSAAHAIQSCAGSLTGDNFVDETKQVQNDLQKAILKYRKLETQAAGSPEIQAEMVKVKAEIDTQKAKYLQLTSKYFPNTPVIAYGSACNDRRWLETAKAKLVEKPENLGKQWYVWLDKSTRQPKAALQRPSFDLMAE